MSLTKEHYLKNIYIEDINPYDKELVDFKHKEKYFTKTKTKNVCQSMQQQPGTVKEN